MRRHQLGLPAGSHMGDGADWRTPPDGSATGRRHAARRRRDLLRARPVRLRPVYGHVGIVENVGADGLVTTSECGSSFNGKPFSRTFTAEQAAQLQFIHY